MKTATKFLVALIIFLAAGTLNADNTPLFVTPEVSLYGGLGEPLDPLPAKEALRTGTLENGLVYYILENSLPGDRAYLTLAVNAGSILEDDDERGYAHFVEHMAFAGTRRFPGAELINFLRSLGMRFGPEVNAYTSFSETVYGIESPIEKDQNGVKRIPDRSLAILEDWIQAVTFNTEDVEKERPIILEEYRTRLDAWERVRQETLPVIFRGSRYKDRLPIGLPETIEKATRDRLLDFYKRWYRPDNMAIILVGDFNGEVLEKELTRHFTSPAAGSPLSRPYFELPDPEKGTITAAVVTDEELSASVVYLYHKLNPETRVFNLRYYRESIIDYLIETMIDYRFEEKIAVENTPYMDTGSWKNYYGELSRHFIMAATAKTNRSKETFEALLLEKERLLRYGFTQTELDRAKGTLLSGLERMTAEKDREESELYISELTAHFLRQKVALDIEWENDAVRRLLPGIGLNAVNSALRAYFADDDLTVIITAPEAEAAGLPDEAAIISLVKAAGAAVIAAPAEKETAVKLITETVKPGSVISVTEDPSKAEIWELSNGMKIILMPTANKNNELNFYALARGGTINAGKTDSEDLLYDLGFSQEEIHYSAMLAAEMQTASGLGSLSKPELMDFLSDKQLSLSFWAGSHTRGLRGSSSLKDLEVLFQLLYVSFSGPRIDQNGFSVVKDYHSTRLIQEAENPESIFFNELSKLIYSENPLFMPLLPSDLDHLNEKAALAFLTLALNPADYTIVFAGNLGNKKELKGLAETWLASIPNSELPRLNTWIDPEIKRPGKTEKIIYKGKEERSIVYMGFYVPKTWTEADNAAVLVLNEYLDIVLTDEIREKLGGVYSISSVTTFSPAPVGELSLEIYFICDPRREKELRDAVKEQLASLSEVVDNETFNKSKEALVKTFERSMENNGFIARNLANFTVITGSPLANLAERPGLYRSVKETELRSLIKELLAGGPIELVLLPESADN